MPKKVMEGGAAGPGNEAEGSSKVLEGEGNVTLPKIRIIHPSIHSTGEHLCWAQHCLKVDTFQPQEPRKPWKGNMLGRKENLGEPPPLPPVS